jgi:hypothetical protein
MRLEDAKSVTALSQPSRLSIAKLLSLKKIEHASSLWNAENLLQLHHQAPVILGHVAARREIGRDGMGWNWLE